MADPNSPDTSVRITADVTQFQSALASLQQGLNDLNKSFQPVTQTTQKVKGSFDKLKDSVISVDKHLNPLSSRFSNSARNMLAMAAGAVGVGLGIGAMTRAVILGNDELEKMEKQVGGTLFAFRDWKKGVDAVTAYRASLRDAKKDYVPVIEAAEELYAVPAQQMAGAIQSLTGALGPSGVGEKRILNLATQMGAATKLFGGEATRNAETLGRIWTSGVIPTRSQDPFTAFLRSTLSGFGDLKKANPEQVFGAIERAMKRLEPAAKEASVGFSDTIFRIKDFFADTLRDIGGPAFKHITAEIGRWNKALKQTNAEGKTLAEVYSGRVLSGVRGIGSALEFVLSHWKAITAAILGAGLALKGVGIAATLSAGGVAAATLATQLTLVAGAASLVGGAIAGWKLGEQLNDATSILGATSIGRTYRAASDLLGQVTGIGGPSDEEMATEAALRAGADAKFKDYMKHKAPQPGPWAGGMVMRGANAGMLTRPPGQEDLVPPTSQLVKPDKGKIVQHFSGPLTIKQEFQGQEDPDNIVIAFREGLENLGRNRLQSALTDGFGG